MELDPVLKHIHGLIVSYRDKKGLGNNEFARLAQLSNTAIKPIEGEKRTDKGKLKTIDLATLIKILNAYPELRVEVLDYLSGNTEINHTPVDTANDNKEKAPASKAEALGLLDKHPDYYLMPKFLLEHHRLISLEQMKMDRAAFDALMEKYDNAIIKLAELEAKLPSTEKAK